MTTRLHISFSLIILAIFLSLAPMSHAVTTIDVPGATYTRTVAINNFGNIVGYYDTSTGTHGFFLDHAGGTFTPIDYPGATFTQARGINDAGNIVGVYSDGTKIRGFFLDHVGGSFTLIDYPGAASTVVYSINNSGNIVGSYTAAGEHGFYLTAVGGSFTTIDIPNAQFTTAVGINDSGKITGNYRDSTGTHGYFLNHVGGAFTPINYPGAVGTFTDSLNNIGNIVGSYDNGGTRRGYILNAVGGKFSPIDFPGAIDTPHLGINDAGSIVGIYSDTSGIFHGFLSTQAEVLTPTEYQVTFAIAPVQNTTPTLGHDALGDFVVYTSYGATQYGVGQSDIYYQRLDNNGQTIGSPVLVAGTTLDERLNDVSGDYIVYTAFQSTMSFAGNILLYQISTGETRELDSSPYNWSPKINGDWVLWLKANAQGYQIMLYRLSWGVPVLPISIVGPIPSPGEVEIGDRFVVWSQIVNNQYDVAAYDLQHGVSFAIANSQPLFERFPSTSGPWAAYQVINPAQSSVSSIHMVNLDNGEKRIIADNGAYNGNINVDGNFVSYESNVMGNYDIFVYRIMEGDTFQVTTRPDDQRLNDLLGNLITYVDQRTGNLDIFVSKIDFVLVPPTQLPVANAGPDQTVHIGNLVTLDGSGSSDPGGFVPLTYAWSVGSKPADSAAALSNPTAVNPTFTVDLPGDYVVQLVVTNSVGLASIPATVTISTTNTPPVASAGPDQAVTLIGTTVHLDGSQSYDPDGDAITYAWSFASIPSGSAATLSNPHIVNPTFKADVQGTFVAQLVVHDPWSQSAPSMVTISFQNVKPVANAGTSQSAIVGDTVTLNGSGSSDANGDSLTYQWSFASVPAGSASSLASPTSVATSFIPDLPGTYVVQLIVNDGFVNSDPSTVQEQVVTSTSAAVEETKALQEIIASLDPAVLKNATMQNALTNKLNAVIANIAAGNYASALDQLQNDILQKTDGCATTGAPDKNDWIKTCNEQNEVYPYVMKLIQLIDSME